MDNHVPPFIKSPVTDMFGHIMNYQNHPDCWKRELQLIDCLEAYGPNHAKTKCTSLVNDLKECVFGSKRRHRVIIMREERERQVRDGERDPANKYAKAPPMDGY